MSQTWLLAIAALIAAPSMLCYLLLPVLAVLFIGLENLFKAQDGKKQRIADGALDHFHIDHNPRRRADRLGPEVNADW